MKAWPTLLLLAGCVAPAPAPRSATPLATPIVLVVPAPPATTVGVTAPPARQVLHDSSVLVAEAKRYVAWKGSKSANIQTLSILAGQVTRDIDAMRASRRHGRYAIERVRAARASIAALSSFLATKGD